MPRPIILIEEHQSRLNKEKTYLISAYHQQIKVSKWWIEDEELYQYENDYCIENEEGVKRALKEQQFEYLLEFINDLN